MLSFAGDFMDCMCVLFDLNPLLSVSRDVKIGSVNVSVYYFFIFKM